MRKPFNRLTFRSETRGAAEQPMLNPGLRLRYDRPALADLCGAEDLVSALDLEGDPGEPNMDVTGAGSIGGAGAIRPAQFAPSQGVSHAAPTGLTAPQDEVQISSAARALGQLEQAGQIHETRLAEIRAAIADGSYETAEKLEAAVDKLLQAIRGQR
jgi:negative regulator of flagellin synthesis FlgM